MDEFEESREKNMEIPQQRIQQSAEVENQSIVEAIDEISEV